MFVTTVVLELYLICRFPRTSKSRAGRSRERVGDETVHEFFKEEAILVAISRTRPVMRADTK